MTWVWRIVLLLIALLALLTIPSPSGAQTPSGSRPADGAIAGSGASAQQDEDAPG
jgi:hypothetical protein